MIYYPLSTLMLAGIRDILIIATPEDKPKYQALFADGSRFGLRISHAIQPRPEGLAQAFIIGREHIGDDNACLILGDNIFFGYGFSEILQRATQMQTGGLVFGYWVRDPERYGVAEFDANGRVVSLEEKPDRPKSNYAVTGLYFYDDQVCDLAAGLTPSARGELEITDLNRLYLQQGQLELVQLGRGMAWLDTGTHDSLMEAGSFVETIEKRQGLKVCCPEEIAWRNGWIDDAEVRAIAEPLRKNGYGQYLLEMLQHGSPS